MKERRKKKKELESAQKDKVNSNGTGGKLPQSGINPETDTTTINEYSNNIQTEIRTDDFVVRLLLFNIHLKKKFQKNNLCALLCAHFKSIKQLFKAL